ncbi:hypothetical protein [Streptacidiphilus sp. PAMC 29251]
MSANPPVLSSTIHDFLCEYRDEDNRVLALTSTPDRPETLRQVLSCPTREFADYAAELLRAALHRRPYLLAEAQVNALSLQLSATQEADLHQGLLYAALGAWPCRSESPAVTRENDSSGAGGCGTVHSAHVQGLRLHELPGSVVRMARLTEYHVRSPALVLAAADAKGWTAVVPGERFEHDPEDLAGAIEYLVNDGSFIAGTDLIADEVICTALNQAEADEVASWSRIPVIADFGSGWQHESVPPLDVACCGNSLPDFARLFPIPSRPEDLAATAWRLTPRTAAVLYAGLQRLSDEALDDAEFLGDTAITKEDVVSGQIFARLPEDTWKNTKQWRIDFARCLDKLAEELADGTVPDSADTSDEAWALLLTLHDAPASLHQLEGLEHFERLPRHRCDHTWHDGYAYGDRD